MARLLFILILFVVSLLVVKFIRNKLDKNKRIDQNNSNSNDRKANNNKTKVLKCVECGLHIPEHEAIKQGNLVFCSLEHARQRLE